MHEAKENREEKMDMHPGGKIEACERSTLLVPGILHCHFFLTVYLQSCSTDQWKEGLLKV